LSEDVRERRIPTAPPTKSPPERSFDQPAKKIDARPPDRAARRTEPVPLRPVRQAGGDAMTTAADILVQTLIDWKVEFVFGLPGDGINGIMEALRIRQDEIGFVQVRHEESAAFMACAYAKWTGGSASAWPPRVPAEPIS
jgi:hypothetical protein